MFWSAAFSFTNPNNIYIWCVSGKSHWPLFHVVNFLAVSKNTGIAEYKEHQFLLKVEFRKSIYSVCKTYSKWKNSWKNQGGSFYYLFIALFNPNFSPGAQGGLDGDLASFDRTTGTLWSKICWKRLTGPIITYGASTACNGFESGFQSPVFFISL